jgi:hypothetical protein
VPNLEGWLKAELGNWEEDYSNPRQEMRYQKKEAQKEEKQP